MNSMENEIDVRFSIFLRSCFLVEIIDGLKWFSIFGPWNYVKYYYQLIDTIAVESLLMWIAVSSVYTVVFAFVILVGLGDAASPSLLQSTGMSIIVFFIGSLTVNMHSWYRWWKRKVTRLCG